jgi:hypothetical protein
MKWGKLVCCEELDETASKSRQLRLANRMNGAGKRMNGSVFQVSLPTPSSLSPSANVSLYLSYNVQDHEIEFRFVDKKCVP